MGDWAMDDMRGAFDRDGFGLGEIPVEDDQIEGDLIAHARQRIRRVMSVIFGGG